MTRTKLSLFIGIAVTAGAAVIAAQGSGDQRLGQLQRAIALYDANTPLTGIGVGAPRDRLHQAIKSGNEEQVLRLLVAQSRNQQPVAEGRESPLIAAIAAGQLTIARYLIEGGYDVHAKNRIDQTALHLAAARNLADAVSFLLANGFNQIDARDHRGRTALLIAIHKGYNAIAELLLAEGADPDLAEENKRAPLHVAVTNNDEAMLALLLEYGTDTTAEYRHRHSILEHTIASNNLPMARILLANGKNRDRIDGTMLRKAAKSGRSDVIRLFADTGVKLDTPDHKGVTALFHAIKGRHPGVVNALLESGIDANSVDRSGRSALSQAIQCVACMDRLIDAGADLNYGGQSKAKPLVPTPLIAAVWAKRVAAAHHLLRAGADVARADNLGRQPIEHAAGGKGMADMIRLLVAHGADPNAHDGDKWPPLTQAVVTGDTETIRSASEQQRPRQDRIARDRARWSRRNHPAAARRWCRG